MPDVQKQISAQLAFIADDLNVWAQANGGSAIVVSNLQDLWAQSSQSSQKPLIYVFYAGEDPWGDFKTAAVTHRVKRNWVVRVKQGRGFTSPRGTTVLTFADSVEHIRDMIRAMLGISEDNGNDYAGIKPVRLGDQVIDCYDISFSTMNDLPTILETPDDNPSSP